MNPNSSRNQDIIILKVILIPKQLDLTRIEHKNLALDHILWKRVAQLQISSINTKRQMMARFL